MDAQPYKLRKRTDETASPSFFQPAKSRGWRCTSVQCGGLTLNPLSSATCLNPECRLPRASWGCETPSKPVGGSALAADADGQQRPLMLPFTIDEDEETTSPPPAAANKPVARPPIRRRRAPPKPPPPPVFLPIGARLEVSWFPSRHAKEKAWYPGTVMRVEDVQDGRRRLHHISYDGEAAQQIHDLASGRHPWRRLPGVSGAPAHLRGLEMYENSHEEQEDEDEEEEGEDAEVDEEVAAAAAAASGGDAGGEYDGGDYDDGDFDGDYGEHMPSLASSAAPSPVSRALPGPNGAVAARPLPPPPRPPPRAVSTGPASQAPPLPAKRVAASPAPRPKRPAPCPPQQPAGAMTAPWVPHHGVARASSSAAASAAAADPLFDEEMNVGDENDDDDAASHKSGPGLGPDEQATEGDEQATEGGGGVEPSPTSNALTGAEFAKAAAATAAAAAAEAKAAAAAARGAAEEAGGVLSENGSQQPGAEAAGKKRTPPQRPRGRPKDGRGEED